MEEHLRNLSAEGTRNAHSISPALPDDLHHHHDEEDGHEADQMKESMHRDALLRSRLLSSRHSFTHSSGGEELMDGGGLAHLHLGSSPRPGLGIMTGGDRERGDFDNGINLPQHQQQHQQQQQQQQQQPPPPEPIDDRGRSISFSSTSVEPATRPGLGGAAGGTSTAAAEGPEERYSVRDLFPDYPEQFLPEMQDFQRVIILNTPEPVDSDTLAACRQLRKAMKLRSKWMGVPLDPEAPPTGPGMTISTGYGSAAAQSYPESPVYYSSTPPAPPVPSPPHLMGRAAPLPTAPPVLPPGSPDSPRTSAYKRMKRRQAPPYDPFSYEPPGASSHRVELVDGVYHVWEGEEVEDGGEGGEAVTQIFSVEEFYEDFHELTHLLTSGPVKTYSYKRLQVLEARFHLHKLLNSDRELSAQKSVPHRDFYNIRKVDTHVHHSACMHLKHLLRFIKHKLKTAGGEIVAFRDGQFLTLKEVFQSLKITAMDLSVDTLDMHANNTFHRFDRFNLKYNPAGQSRLREIFLKTDNMIAGTYLAEVTQQVISDLDASKYQLVEWRVSIYGRKPSEWDKLARWFYTHRLASDKVRWLIQIPRLYAVYKASGELENFEHLLRNIFAPLFEVTRDPGSNPPLAIFLNTIVGFDCVDDESKPEIHANQGQSFPAPKHWQYKQDPPYSYWCYYIAANIKSLNDFRRAREMSTFEFRPHCGEAGDPEHLVAAYLLAEKINHGIVLRKIPGLQLLYYLSQIGIAMSPLSNNKLFLDYHRNPFVKYFHQGLNVSLSTDDPLMLHYTKDPLVEEYSVAAQVWRLSSTDLCEMARNSVLQSGFEDVFKRHFLGRHYDAPGAAGNDIRQTNVPDIRVRYRHEAWRNEMDMVVYCDRDPAMGKPTGRGGKKLGWTLG